MVIGEVVFQGVTTGRSALRQASFWLLNIVTQLSNFSSATFFVRSSFDTYFGWNCFR